MTLQPIDNARGGIDVGGITPKAVAILWIDRERGLDSDFGQCAEEFDGLTGRRILVATAGQNQRSEEHTSELQSLMRISYAVFCLKKKTEIKSTIRTE